MPSSTECHVCGKPAYGDLKGKGGVALPICLGHYIEFQGVENERQRQLEAQMRNSMAMMNLASAEMAAITGFTTPMVQIPPPAPANSYTSINVTDSTVGVINTAAVQQITSSVNALPRENPVRKALLDFTTAVTADAGLTDEGKKQFLDMLTVVSEQAATTPEKRKTAVIQPVLSAIAQGAQTITGLAGAWTAVEPIIKAHFGL